MRTPSNGSISAFVALTKASDAEIRCFLWSAPEQTVGQIIVMPVIWDAIALFMKSLWCFILIQSYWDILTCFFFNKCALMIKELCSSIDGTRPSKVQWRVVDTPLCFLPNLFKCQWLRLLFCSTDYFLFNDWQDLAKCLWSTRFRECLLINLSFNYLQDSE